MHIDNRPWQVPSAEDFEREPLLKFSRNKTFDKTFG